MPNSNVDRGGERRCPGSTAAEKGWRRPAGAPAPFPRRPQERQRPACAGRAGGGVCASCLGRKLVVCCVGGNPYFVQLVDQELRLQLERVGSIEPLFVREHAQLQL